MNIKELLLKNKQVFNGLVSDLEFQKFSNDFNASFLVQRDLKNSTLASILNCALFVAKTGLSPDPRLREMFFQREYNPHIDQYEVIPILGLMGTLKMIRRSGDVSVIDAGVIYGDQTPSYSIGTNAFFEIGDRGKCFEDKDVTHFFAYVILKDGNKLVDVIPVEQIAAKRDSDKEKEKAKKNESYYHNHFIAMGKRDVLKECTRYMELSDVYSQLTMLEEVSDNFQYDLISRGADDSILHTMEDSEQKKAETKAKALEAKKEAEKQRKIELAKDIASQGMKKTTKTKK